MMGSKEQKAKDLAAAKADWKRQVAGGGRKSKIEDYSRLSGKPKGSDLKVGENLGGELFTNTRGKGNATSLVHGSYVPPKSGPATEVEKATLESAARYVRANKEINDKYKLKSLPFSGQSDKADAEKAVARRKMAPEARMTAQARSWQEAQKRTPEAIAKKAAVQKKLDAAMKKARGK
jgi:hypothetical protein